jgi:UbiD family decarboxylase
MQQPLRKEQQTPLKPNQAFDLRSTLEWLRAEGELIETDKEVDPDLQVTGLQKHMDGGCPVLFNTVKGKPNHRVITNLFGDIAVINRMFRSSRWRSRRARRRARNTWSRSRTT